MKWEPVIGLEVHTQLSTQSKIFSGTSTAYGAEPNTQASFIDLGMPGTLPTLNKAVVEMAIKFGLAAHAEIAKESIFARKNYFYPDLPKGYQISQYEHPIVKQGYIDIVTSQGSKRIGITRAHLEEDAGKSLHDIKVGFSAIDLNRAGTPLLEIVSEPELRSAEEALAYLKNLYLLVSYLEICDGNMQEGSFRIDVNVSVRPLGSSTFGTRVEVKNINSFKFVEQAILFEIERQIQILENSGTIIQETRLYDSQQGETRSMRGKEEANDYRYFPDPDLLPLIISEEWLESIKNTLPELPEAKRVRFQSQYGLSDYDIGVLITDKPLSAYFEETVNLTTIAPKIVANWTTVELLALLNKHNISIQNSPISPKILSHLLNRIQDGTISGKIAKTLLEQVWETGQEIDHLIQSQNLTQVTDQSALNHLIESIMVKHPHQVEEYRSGKEKLFGFFIGQIMKESQGRANPDQINALLKEKLSSTSN